MENWSVCQAQAHSILFWKPYKANIFTWVKNDVTFSASKKLSKLFIETELLLVLRLQEESDQLTNNCFPLPLLCEGKPVISAKIAN